MAAPSPCLHTIVSPLPLCSQLKNLDISGKDFQCWWCLLHNSIVSTSFRHLLDCTVLPVCSFCTGYEDRYHLATRCPYKAFLWLVYYLCFLALMIFGFAWPLILVINALQMIILFSWVKYSPLFGHTTINTHWAQLPIGSTVCLLIGPSRLSHKANCMKAVIPFDLISLNKDATNAKKKIMEIVYYVQWFSFMQLVSMKVILLKVAQDEYLNCEIKYCKPLRKK